MPDAELIVPKSAVGAVVSMLNARLEPKVASRVPNPRPKTFVRVSRAGGRMSNLITDRATLIFECWAPDSVAAESLANTLRATMRAAQFEFVDGVRLLGWEEAGCAEFDDPDVTDQSRWQVTGTLGVSVQ